MISPELMQEVILDKLKANTALANALGLEFREASWQGKDFVYPCIRVKLGEQRPLGDGNCHETESVQAWTVQVYSEKASSFECSQLAGLVVSALFGKHLVGTGFRSLQVNSGGVLPPFRSTPQVWRSDVAFIANFY